MTHASGTEDSGRPGAYYRITDPQKYVDFMLSNPNAIPLEELVTIITRRIVNGVGNENEHKVLEILVTRCNENGTR